MSTFCLPLLLQPPHLPTVWTWSIVLTARGCGPSKTFLPPLTIGLEGHTSGDSSLWQGSHSDKVKPQPRLDCLKLSGSTTSSLAAPHLAGDNQGVIISKIFTNWRSSWPRCQPGRWEGGYIWLSLVRSKEISPRTRADTVSYSRLQFHWK